ncbi:methionine ABC transporter ATP-binding protein [Phyllobacterium zundukense]|uniref:Cell division ATP-binding protein FtsE n=1 Tax=Phyllobacterium zundukense TaxID=1867719 RepID=A0A2N9VY95_9HYPH|nr:ATP-binding cassette domain-containing protein [Phyllobacterium zundukense]ATU95058.1 methionine ABC transporter ATP-binding protein [Phyllobacterium zundukense]PIO44463.1 methionine ABC transporter ATP-binding protein [Phyllobacterium zundukense]
MIRLEQISKSFVVQDGFARALSEIDLTINQGEIFGIIGSSGAGKSTLVRLINLLERPSSGDVFFDGERITNYQGAQLRALRRKIGMVFQHFNLLSARTVAANVAYPLQLAGIHDKVEIARRVAVLLDRVGLSEHAEKYPRQLSGGQKQRVGIARALASEPTVLLCDEATSALDPQTTISVLDLLQEINRDLGVTIVIITHEMDVIRRACDSVAVLDHGQIVETGAVADVFLHPQHHATLNLLRETEPDQAMDEKAASSVPAGRLLRLTLVGPAARKAILGRIARENAVDYAILSGRVGHIRQLPYAQLTIALSGRDVDSAIAGLRSGGVTVEQLDALPEPAVAPDAQADPRRGLIHVA